MPEKSTQSMSIIQGGENMIGRVFGRGRLRGAGAAACLVMVLASAGVARADNSVMLQWFESRWDTIEYRVPDFFLAGYRSVWLPPPSRCSDPSSPGYDPFDRFDLGSPGLPTLYGTQSRLQAMVSELHQANGLVYFDWIMNHNSSRTTNAAFFAAGAWPGFVVTAPGLPWGDFHVSGKQAENPNNPNYDVWNGDLLGLIDIAQETNIQLIRQPIDSTNPLNIPAGTTYNRPNTNNRQFYPDSNPLTGTPLTFTNPLLGTPQTVWKFNTQNPMSGVPVAENGTGLLIRASQWMVEVNGADGFRLDAAKHIPQWFWNQYFDSAIYQRRVTPGGSIVNPFTFGEVVDGNGFIRTYTRKDAFADRDALDLNGAGALRDLMNARGLGSWSTVIGAHLDNADDGFNNGTLGVNHVFSHDNGSAGNGSTAPALPDSSLYAMPEFCYLLFRTGLPIVYHNARQFATQFTSRGFWPREGSPTAMGQFNNDLVKLVQLSNGYGHGLFVPINDTDPVNQSNADVLVFERRRNNTDGSRVGNVVVGVNDSYSSGVQQRSVVVSYPQGARLHELTGNHGDPVVDPNNQIPELLTVGAGGRVLLTIPNNKNANGVDHHKGYVVYGLAAPSGTLSVSPVASTLAADPVSVPSAARRLNPIEVVTSDTFTLRLQTEKTDPLDPEWDDFAAFRIDQGFRDFNANGGVDFPENDAFIPGFERFLTTNQPLYNTANTNGVYEQTIDARQLSEGYHYISVMCFRRRAANSEPIFTEFRKVIYVDRTPPSVTLPNPTAPFATTNVSLSLRANDRTTNNVYVLVNPPTGADPLTLINPSNQASQYDRLEWRRNVTGLLPCVNRLTVVAFEITGRASITNYSIRVSTCAAKFTCDGTGISVQDIFAFLRYWFARDPFADFDGNQTINVGDIFAFLRAWFAGCPA